MKRRDKKSGKQDLYLSDKQPLTTMGKVGLALTYIFLSLYAINVIWPIAQIVISSFNGDQQQYIRLGDTYTFSLRHFDFLFNETHFFLWLRNTIFISLASTLVTIVIVSFTGYAYSRFRFTGRKASLLTIMLIQVIPTFAGITAYFTLHSIISSIVPAFSRQMMLVAIYAGGGIATNTFIMKGYIDSISAELDEAARIDGCSNLSVYRMIILPIVRPMLAIVALWSFIGPFTDYMLPKVLLTTPRDYTMATGLFSLVNDARNMNQPAFAAGSLITAIPIVILFMLLQNQLVSGLAAGSVKG